jgi:hypothetical protein
MSLPYVVVTIELAVDDPDVFAARAFRQAGDCASRRGVSRRTCYVRCRAEEP